MCPLVVMVMWFAWVIWEEFFSSGNTPEGCTKVHFFHMWNMTGVLHIYYRCLNRPHDTIHPLNIANIRNIDLLPATPFNIPLPFSISPDSFNIYEFLLPSLISNNPHYPLLIYTAPLISTNSDNPHPISIIWT